MEYQKIANLLDSASNQPFKFRTKNWAEINDKSRGTHSFNGQINFKTSMLRSNTNKKVIFKNLLDLPTA